MQRPSGISTPDPVGLTDPLPLRRDQLLGAIGPDFALRRGSALPLGSTVQRDGVNFAVFSEHAAAVTLVLFIPGEPEPFVEFPLDARWHRTGSIWHVFVQGLDPGVAYGYRVNGLPQRPAQVLLDPYARLLAGGGWKWTGRRQSLVTTTEFDWGFDQPLNIPLADTILYELHVRGFTQDPSSQVIHPGTYLGLTEKIPYLKRLGVTAVELMPVQEFDETENPRVNPDTGEKLFNYWGYNTIAFFAPKRAYAATPYPDREFKEMVKRFHAAGMEVILDVVFNHTAEGPADGPVHSFRGLDERVYYILDSATGAYRDYTGCGNTLNCNHPVVRDLVLDALRYWVTEMHVDGFRFDLASVLGRGRDGEVLAHPPLLERIAADPILAHSKLIAEAWDAAGLYQVGRFPAWGRWAEWNGRFRDDIRRFVKGDAGMATALATRLAGSADLYQSSGRLPFHSINFTTCHDGFTLADLVSYNEKSNLSNGESNADGAGDNHSWDCGGDSELRLRQTKNLAALTLLAHGVPMLLAGDEFGRTQQGNNNAFCHDGPLSWIDWTLREENQSLERFFRSLIAFRRAQPALRRSAWEGGAMLWHGLRPGQPDWSCDSRTLALQLVPDGAGDHIYILANAHWEAHDFELPRLGWRRFLDTSLPSPADIGEPGEPLAFWSGSVYRAAPRSVAVLIAPAPQPEGGA